MPLTHVREGRIVLTPMFEPELWMRLVDEHGITGTAMAPTMLNMVLQHPKINEYRLDTLRGVLYGAAAMPVEVLRTAIERFGPIVYSGFGMTELGGNVLTFPKSAHAHAIKGEEHLLASCGTPMCLADVRVVDEDMKECAPGVVGEMVIRGEQVLKGYFRNAEGNKKAFEGGWFHTGDMARRDAEGFFYIVDRMKDMIITGGENVYSREVEEVLYTRPAVSEAAVVGLPDPVWGENVTAVVVLRPGMTATEAEIIASARDRLAGFKKPKRVIFLDELRQGSQRQDHQTRAARSVRDERQRIGRAGVEIRGDAQRARLPSAAGPRFTMRVGCGERLPGGYGVDELRQLHMTQLREMLPVEHASPLQRLSSVKSPAA